MFVSFAMDEWLKCDHFYDSCERCCPWFYSKKMNEKPPAFHRYTCPVTLRKGECDCQHFKYASAIEDETMGSEEEDDFTQNCQNENAYRIAEEAVRKTKDAQPKSDTKRDVTKKERHDDRDKRSGNQGSRHIHKSSGRN